MQQLYLNIALLLFTRTSEEEVKVKNLVPQGSEAQQLAVAEKLIQNGEQILAATGLSYFVYSSAAQKGNNFGERLQNAFADLFSRGFDKVIVIGNDCPQLKPADILKAAHKLNEQQVVVGPDTSGGVYLLGLNQKAFNQKAAFKNIRWNTAWVLTDIAAAFEIAPDELTYLNKYADLNNCRAFTKAFRQKLFRPALLRYFRLLFNLLNFWLLLSQKIVISAVTLPSLSLRGPPSLN